MKEYIQNDFSTNNENKFQKLKKELQLNKNNIVLILYGSFYPPHLNHVQTLDVAKKYIEKFRFQDFNVLGGIFIPTNQAVLKKKFLQDEIILDNIQRKKCIDLILENNKWISPFYDLIDSKNNIGIGQGSQLLEAQLKQFYQKQLQNEQQNSQQELQDLKNYNIDIISVMGTDKIQFIKKATKKPVVIVQNRKNQDSESQIKPEKFIQDFINQKDQQNQEILKKNIIFVKDESVQNEMSSTKVRNLIQDQNYQELNQYLPQNLVQYLQDTLKHQKEQNTIMQNQTNILIQKQLTQQQQIDLMIDKINNEKQFIIFDLEKDFNIEQIQNQQNNKIGAGVSAQVYALNLQNQDKFKSLNLYDQKVAVKIFNLGKSKQKRPIEYFIRELQILKILKNENHPNIIQVFGCGTYFDNNSNDLYTFIVFELAQYTNSLQFVRQMENQIWKKSQNNQNQQKNQELQNINDQKGCVPNYFFQQLALLADALSLFKQNKIVHRDNSFSLKLIDFGLSAFEENVNILRGCTKHYSPESIKQKDIYDEKSDVYMFGNVIYELVHQEEDLSVEQARKQILIGNRPQWYSDCVALKPLCQRCWDPNPQNRPTFAEIKYILTQLCQQD
ncbi:Protein kinase-like domain [Pseudocohnilembus persalinus]|uniref:Protein kinase-like domain n=1 Tax=Pseudocohnilembus persalinus TaxID=266149 RepID=A0A0V0Q7T6_PSEPJ|nr:Protein kinase-like domain [Pseudocohnilembus persalinus]|eukprot:KRW98223.1 Protein kinase-like domain [Pseudocohnilembus persalinus]